MRATRSTGRAGLVLASVLVGAACAGAGLAAATRRPAGPPPAEAPAVQAANYVGDDTCLACHDDKGYAGTAHGRRYDGKTPAATRGCESCHGPGKDHVDGQGDTSKIVNPGTLSVRQASDTCTTCHNRATHALWDGSQHDMRQVGCLNCHSVHSAAGPRQLKAKDQMSLCGQCHRAIVNKQFRFNHMPVREGKMDCSSCHNVHGSVNVKLLKVGTSVDESCWSCHAEKRGPFLWDHAPVSESCTTCHDPHGSNNDRMLVAKQPYLCQRCHVTSRHPPTVYEGYQLQNSSNANKIIGRSCVSCHQMVHGSNAPSGKAFLR